MHMNMSCDLEYPEILAQSPYRELLDYQLIDVVLINGETKERITVEDIQITVNEQKMYNLTEILSILQSKGLVKDKMTINLYEDGLPIPCGRYPNLDFSLFFLKRNQLHSNHSNKIEIVIEYFAPQLKEDYSIPFDTYLYDTQRHVNPMSNHLELSFFNDTSSSTRESVNDNLPFIFEDLDFSNEKSEKSESNQSYESFDNFLEIDTKQTKNPIDDLLNTCFNSDIEPIQQIAKGSYLKSDSIMDDFFSQQSPQNSQNTLYTTSNQPPRRPRKPITKEFTFFKTHNKRPKERIICTVMDTVFQWRRLYRQQRNTLQSNQKKNTLEQAAKQLGYKKKSLDDYLRQIRYGAKFGFDFEANKNKKIGKLRAFVKKQMKIALERKKPDESERIFLKNLPFNSNTLTNAEISLLTDLKPVKKTTH